MNEHKYAKYETRLNWVESHLPEVYVRMLGACANKDLDNYWRIVGSSDEMRSFPESTLAAFPEILENRFYNGDLTNAKTRSTAAKKLRIARSGFSVIEGEGRDSHEGNLTKIYLVKDHDQL